MFKHLFYFLKCRLRAKDGNLNLFCQIRLQLLCYVFKIVQEARSRQFAINLVIILPYERILILPLQILNYAIRLTNRQCFLKQFGLQISISQLCLLLENHLWNLSGFALKV